MTDDSASAEPQTDDPLSALMDRPLTELSVDELMALKEVYEARGQRMYDSLHLDHWELLAIGPLSAAIAIYTKAYLETLAKHNAEALIETLSGYFRKKDTEFLVGPEDGSAATLVITSKTPDEARLALLDLDVTSEELRGKVLRWDQEAMAWRPDDAQE